MSIISIIAPFYRLLSRNVLAPEPHGLSSRQVSGIRSASALRYITIIALLISTISCAGTQSTDLSVDRAISTRDRVGNATVEVFLTDESSRNFAVFTSKALGRLIELRFLNQTLAIVRLRLPILDGHFPIGVSASGALNEDNAEEIASRLSSNIAKLEVRVLEEKK
jgi:preprotein translocase subunit SecD